MRSLWEYLLNASVLLVAVILLSALPVGAKAGEDRPAPQIGGQTVPNVGHTIDFGKRYNVVCTDSRQDRIYENVRIAGFVNGEQHKSVKGGYNDQSRWLVLERADGRKVYLSGYAISALEETGQQKR